MSDAKPIAMQVPAGGEKITVADGKLRVPDQPIIPFIEGDGTGPDIWRASVRVFDAAVQKAYGSKRKIHWMEVFAGEKANRNYNTWLPDETVAACREYLVSIKGPLTTPVGGGIRSLNVALRQLLDLYVCLRPVRWFKGVPSPVVAPEKVDMVIFRENTEDIYAGIEFEAGSADVQEIPRPVQAEPFRSSSRRSAFPRPPGIGLKPASKEGTERLFRAAVRVRDRQQAQERDHRAQGQHHEIHRRRLPQLVLPAGRARVRRSRIHLGTMGADQERAAASRRRMRRWTPRSRPARSSSRTPSPTSPCSRCSRVPTSSTWSPP